MARPRAKRSTARYVRVKLALSEAYATHNGLYVRFASIREQHPTLTEEQLHQDFEPLCRADDALTEAIRAWGVPCGLARKLAGFPS